jgi:hypothetical protein
VISRSRSTAAEPVPMMDVGEALDSVILDERSDLPQLEWSVIYAESNFTIYDNTTLITALSPRPCLTDHLFGA